MKKNNDFTYFGHCYCCGEKFKADGKYMDGLRLFPGSKQSLCTFCFNYKQTRVYRTFFIFLLLIVTTGIVDILFTFVFAGSNEIKRIIAVTYLLWAILFGVYLIVIFHKRLVR